MGCGDMETWGRRLMGDGRWEMGEGKRENED